MKTIYYSITISMFMLCCNSKDEDAKPDIVFPTFVEKRLTVTYEYIPTYVGSLQFLPYGGEVFLYPEPIMNFIR
jgi:hypothetical protein